MADSTASLSEQQTQESPTVKVATVHSRLTFDLEAIKKYGASPHTETVSHIKENEGVKTPAQFANALILDILTTEKEHGRRSKEFSNAKDDLVKGLAILEREIKVFNDKHRKNKPPEPILPEITVKKTKEVLDKYNIFTDTLKTDTPQVVRQSSR